MIASPGREDSVARAAGDRRAVRGARAPASAGTSPSSSSIVRIAVRRAVVARIAAASSVMSIATGHQVMQRPQPTQPDVPNWSIQVASLCVIHCR